MSFPHSDVERCIMEDDSSSDDEPLIRLVTQGPKVATDAPPPSPDGTPPSADDAPPPSPDGTPSSAHDAPPAITRQNSTIG